MKVILVRYYDPCEVIGTNEPLNDEEIRKYCFRVNQYNDGFQALNAYANTPCTWSTLLDEDSNVEWFIDCAIAAIKTHNYDWLEKYFV